MVGRSAIFSGEHFVLEETDWYLLNLFRLWWHYGISFLRLQMWVEEVMEKFMRYARRGLQTPPPTRTPPACAEVEAAGGRGERAVGCPEEQGPV